MRNLKFACPVCGQHITVDETLGGTHLECPTCFRKLLVPKTSGDTKLVLSATEVSAARPGPDLANSIRRSRRPGRLLGFFGSLAVMILVIGGGAAFFWNYKLRRVTEPSDLTTPIHAEPKPGGQGRPGWTLNLAEAVIPDKPATGRLAGKGFVQDRATFRGAVLSLRQGEGWPPDAGVSITFFSDKVAGMTLEVPPDRPPPAPRVTVRWRDEQSQPTNVTLRTGYALKVTFGEIREGQLPGKIFLAFPDDRHSYIAGTFTAEILKADRRSRNDSTNSPTDLP